MFQPGGHTTSNSLEEFDKYILENIPHYKIRSKFSRVNSSHKIRKEGAPQVIGLKNLINIY